MKTIKLHQNPEVGLTGYELVRLRKEAGMTMQTLAIKLETYLNQISRWEAYGKNVFYLSPQRMASVLEALGVEEEK